MIPGVSLRSPDNLSTGFIPSLKASDLNISTWLCFLVGPIILTFSIQPFFAAIVTHSLHANCPGCDKLFIGVSLYPFPKRVSKSSWDKWMCLPDIPTGIL